MKDGGLSREDFATAESFASEALGGGETARRTPCYTGSVPRPGEEIMGCNKAVKLKPHFRMEHAIFSQVASMAN